MLRTVSVGELFFTKNNLVFRLDFCTSFILEEERLDSVLEEVIVSKGTVVEAFAESRSGLLVELVLA